MDGRTTMAACYDYNLPSEWNQSVVNNQGFYIARFEVGEGIVSKQGAKVWNNYYTGTIRSSLSSKYTVENTEYGVVSTAIHGVHWDTALSFIMAYGGDEQYPGFLTDSTGYGNYSTGDDAMSTSEPALCGAYPEFMQKNIYDMAGNVYEVTWEWTTISNGQRPSIFRGGAYDRSRQFICSR